MMAKGLEQHSQQLVALLEERPRPREEARKILGISNSYFTKVKDYITPSLIEIDLDGIKLLALPSPAKRVPIVKTLSLLLWLKYHPTGLLGPTG